MESDSTKKDCAKRFCIDARRYVDRTMASGPRIAVVACEGACAKGEVARMAANVLAYRLERARSARICLGDAVTGESGMAELLEKAPSVVAIEGCPLRCASELLRSRFPRLEIQQVMAPPAYRFEAPGYFEIFDVPREELERHASAVAERARSEQFRNQP